MTCQRLVRDYGDQCKLETFMHLCCLNYVGHTKVDIGLNMLEVCSQVFEVKQVYCKCGRVQHDTPDELYDRYSILAVSLPADAKGRSAQLCSSYFAVLSKNLAEHIATETEFVIPDLTTLTTKTLQINAHCDIHQFTSSSFKFLNKRKDALKELLCEMQPSHNSGMSLEVQGQQDKNEPNGSSYTYQQSSSVAKQTISQYTQSGTQDNQNGNQNGRKMVKTRKHPESGLQHPFNPDNKNFSRFPVEFKGYFNCGQTDHWHTKNFPTANNSNFNKTMFFNEMWAHKPHTKKPPRDFDNNNSCTGSSYFQSNQDSNHNYNQSGNHNFNQGGNNYPTQSGNNTLYQGGNNNNQSGNNTLYQSGNNKNQIDNNTFNRSGNNNNNDQSGNITLHNGGNYNYNTNGYGNGNWKSHYGPSNGSSPSLKRNIDNSPACIQNDGDNNNGRRVGFITKKNDGSQRAHVET